MYKVSRFLFRDKVAPLLTRRKCLQHSLEVCITAFIDNLSSDNVACLRRSASKTKCSVNGAIVRAERKKSKAWVESGKEWHSPDPTRPKPPPFFTTPLLLCRVPFRSVLLNEQLEKACNNKQQLNMSSAYRDMLNSLRHCTSFHQFY